MSEVKNISEDLWGAAEKYKINRLKKVGGSMTVADYVNDDELDYAFIAGGNWVRMVEHVRLQSQLAILRKFAEKIAEYECYVTCDCQMDAQNALKKCFGEGE